jgi:hypothetical protein
MVAASLAAVAVAALLLDDGLLVFSPVLSGVWWGLCIGLALAAVPRRVFVARRSVDVGSAASWRWKRAGAATAFVLAVLWAVRSWAEDAPVNLATSKVTTHQVFFPVDDDQKPVGERVYVPEPLFARLERWNLDRERGPTGWIVTAATYQVRLDWNADGTTLEPNRTTAVVDVLSFDDDARVELPLVLASDAASGGLEGEEGLPAGIRLDGALLESDG